MGGPTADFTNAAILLDSRHSSKFVGLRDSSGPKTGGDEPRLGPCRGNGERVGELERAIDRVTAAIGTAEDVEVIAEPVAERRATRLELEDAMYPELSGKSDGVDVIATDERAIDASRVSSALLFTSSPRPYAGVGKLTIHCVPKRSAHMPKYGPHGAFAIGMATFPPSPLSAWKTLSASALSFATTETWTLFPGLSGGPNPSTASLPIRCTVSVMGS